MNARIRREITKDGDTLRYVHSFCSSCTYWFSFNWTLDDAYRSGERHLINVHNIDARTASTARRAHEHKTTNHEVGGHRG